MKPQLLSKTQQIKKIARFYTIYGFKRSLNKALGRVRHPLIRSFGFKKKPFLSILGSGQFAFSTIGYFIKKNKGLVFLDCYDINPDNSTSLAHYYKFRKVASTPEEVLSNKELSILYIASNHASHTPYGIKAMKAGIRNIYIEKPISVTYDQFYQLIAEQRKTSTQIFAGYNRPYSQAIQFLKKHIEKDPSSKDQSSAFSLNYFISGHLIPDDHWYRNPEEGTRICGNMGHWLDLSIHILAWRKLPQKLNILIAYGRLEEPDDNISISITSDLGDIISIMLTSRSEPFEGINESINFQYRDTIAKIDDFRKMTIWQSDTITKKKFFPKDVGHERAVMQPFLKENRNWEEVEISTLLMLHITDMVRAKQTNSSFNIKEAEAKLNDVIKTQFSYD